MELVFYIAAAIAILATMMVITRVHVVHALLYFVVSLLAIAVALYAMGAPFIAALEVIVYAGAILVLFIFVIMLLGLGPRTTTEERQWLDFRVWIGPALLGVVLLVEVVVLLLRSSGGLTNGVVVEPRQVGVALYGPYVIGVELASLVLLAGLVGAYHLGRRIPHREAEGG